MLVQAPNQLARLDVPNAHGSIDARADQRLSVAQKAQRGDAARVSDKAANRRAGGTIPKLDGAIQAPGEEGIGVPPRHGHRRVVVPFQTLDGCPRRPGEDFDNAVFGRMTAGEGQMVSIGRESQSVKIERGDRDLSLEPHVRPIIHAQSGLRGGDEGFAVGREGQRRDGRLDGARDADREEETKRRGQQSGGHGDRRVGEY